MANREVFSRNDSQKLPAVSIIMNCLNSSKYLRQALDSVYSQTHTDWEIIFWDNASSDNSAEIYQSYDNKLRYFKSENTVKLGKARKLAMEKAVGKYIAFLDCDDVWFPDKLEKQVAVLDKCDSIALIYSNYFILYPNKIKKLVLKGMQPQGNIFESLLHFYAIGILTTIVRKEALDRLGILFDENLNNSEEYDVFMRLLYKTKAAYFNEPLAIYRIHANMGSIKTIDEYPDEIIYIIEKFKRMDPLFENKYSSAISCMLSKVSYSRAKIEMLRGNSSRVRHILSCCKWLNYNFFILFLLTYLPSKLLHSLLNLKTKYILHPHKDSVKINTLNKL